MGGPKNLKQGTSRRSGETSPLQLIVVSLGFAVVVAILGLVAETCWLLIQPSYGRCSVALGQRGLTQPIAVCVKADLTLRGIIK